MSATFSGVGVEELDQTERWNQRTGKTIIRHWKGTPGNISTLVIQARTYGYDYTTHWDGGYLILSVDYPEDSDGDLSTPLSNEWEEDTNFIQKDIWTLPEIQTELRKIGPSGDPTVRGFFRNDLENLARGNPTTVGTDGEETTITLAILLDVASLYGANPEIFFDLFEAMTRGVQAYEMSYSVLRNTIVTSKQSTITSSKESVNKIYTAAAVAALLPATIKFEPEDTGYYIKKKPLVRAIEKGKWEIIQEWWHVDDYEELIYGAPVA